MRALHSKLLAMLFAAFSLTLVAPLMTSAQEINILTVMGSTWSYKSNKTDNPPAYVPADAWTEIGFDDSSWPTGVGLFGLEPGIAAYAPWTINTRIDAPSIGGAGAGPLSSYFRTKFTWTGDPNNVTFQFTNYMDDGILVFLNGVELFSFNVPADRPLPWDTLVLPNTANPLGEGVPFITNVIPSNLVIGDNVIAVALHQQANTTSDDVFGMSLKAILPAAPVNLAPNQPTNRTLLQFRSSLLTVSASGSPAPTYQWFLDGTEIPGANAASLLITNELAETSTSNFFCRVTNPLGSFDSRVATVLYTADNTPPAVVSVRQGGGFDTIIITFNEAISEASAIDAFNWDVTDGVNAPLGAASSSLNADGQSVTVILGSPMLEDTLYTANVGLSGVTDLAGNTMTQVDVQFRSWVTTAYGGVLFETFNTSPDGTAITILTGSPNFPNNPRETYRLNSFSSREVYTDDTHEQFGGRMRALFIPPTSGNWVFYLSSDDAGQLFLNPNGPGESGKILVQQETGCCNPYASHATAPYALEAGKPYYLEAIYKEGGGGDYCHVWAGPQGVPPPSGGATTLGPSTSIPGSMLGAPAAPANVAGTFTITQQPQNQFGVPNSTVTFSVGTSTDALLTYEWFRNGVTIPNANNAQYSLVATPGDDGAKFSVKVSIIAGASIVSDEATLTVGADTIRPTVVSVVANAGGTSLTVTYSEAMGPSAATAGNYSINGVPANSATLNAAGTVATVVPATPLAAGGCTISEVIITGVTDQATVGNLINPNPTTVSLSSPLMVVLPLNATWKYNDSGTDLGTSWRETGFDDTTWLSGPAPLGFEPGTPQVPVVATPLAAGSATNTTYFRTRFNLGVNPSTIAVLQLGEIVDDGAVYYINGVEARRAYMPAAPAAIDFNTLATGGGPEPTDGTHTVVAVNIPAAGLVAGDNVLAVELHPSSRTSSDSEFAAQLSIVLCLPRLTIAHVGSQVRLTWTDAAYRLQTAPAPDGPWSNQAGTSGLLLPASSGNLFVRLVTP